jgi:L-cysteine desulfidase
MTKTLPREKYEAFASLLCEELVPAMGCTEPIAIAYAAARAKEVLGSLPEKCKISVSGNIIKNAKSVVVPHTNGMRGIEVALIAGIISGDSSAKLEVLSRIGKDKISLIGELREKLPIELCVSDSDNAFDIAVTLISGADSSFVRILGRHTNVVLVKKNDEVIYEGTDERENEKKHTALSVAEIVEFADTVDIGDVKEVLDRQIEYNMAIAEEGLRGSWGASIGQVYLSAYAPDISIKAKAYAAAGSDARMNGCELPVIINSGSGNQGMTASVPVIVYWQELGLEKDKLYRALCVSNLITLHIKHGIGTLSAYCGAVAAGAAAGAGIAYLYGGGLREIAHTLVNALAIDSGLICDGAKASCAAKIATAVENGILGFNLFRAGKQFVGGDGIVKKGVENTIENVCRLARDGMKDTDREILNIMVEK